MVREARAADSGLQACLQNLLKPGFLYPGLPANLPD